MAGRPSRRLCRQRVLEAGVNKPHGAELIQRMELGPIRMALPSHEELQCYNVKTSAKIGAVLIIFCFAILVSSCHRSKGTNMKRYHFTGRIISIDAQSESAFIDGDNVPDFMDPMSMSYKIKPASELRQLAPGDSIAADVVVVEKVPKNEDEPSEFWLENLKVTGHAKAPPAKGSGELHMPATGEDVPDFTFTNQDGKPTSLAHYRGKTLLVTFIYTRCPFPDFCPRMSSNFDEVYKQLGTNPSLANAHLISISFDPEHDTPKVLREYAFSVAHTHDAAMFRNWEFVVPRAGRSPEDCRLFRPYGKT